MTQTPSSTPDLIALRLAALRATDNERPAAERALAAAEEAHLDASEAAILEESQHLYEWWTDPRAEAARDRLRQVIDDVIAQHSQREITVKFQGRPQRQLVPAGAIMTGAYRRRGPLVAVAKALLEAITTRQLLEYQRNRDLVIAAREARRKDVVNS